MKILIIDDEKELAEFLKSRFESEGFSVTIASDGEAGFDCAQKGRYDAIILDNVLPKKEGRQVCRDLRKKNIHTPILMLSVKAEVDIKVDLLGVGVDDYLTKPFSFEELLARVKVLMRRPGMIKGEILKLGDLEMDVVNQTVKCKNKEVHLTPKEMAILTCLLKNKNTIISRNAIMDYVWDENADPFSNSIESHIVNIRKKLKNGGKKSFINTISGRGYCIGTVKND